MKNALLITLLTGLFLIGCSPKEPAPNENVDALFQRFHGKYKAVRSTSDKPVDVNLDGVATTDILAELPQLTQPYSNYLELNILGPTAYRAENAFLFTQWWPEQYIRFYDTNKEWNGELVDYDPSASVNYAMQGGTHHFSFSQDLTQMAVQPNEKGSPFRWVQPEFVTINPDDTIQIVNKRRVYTSAGVKDVTITTVYKRFTMVT